MMNVLEHSPDLNPYPSSPPRGRGISFPRLLVGVGADGARHRRPICRIYSNSSPMRAVADISSRPSPLSEQGLPCHIRAAPLLTHNRTRRPDRREPRLGTTFNTGCLQWSVSPVLCGPGDGEQGVGRKGISERSPCRLPPTDYTICETPSKDEIVPTRAQPDRATGWAAHRIRADRCRPAASSMADENRH
jgi:hypothetical protein